MHRIPRKRRPRTPHIPARGLLHLRIPHLPLLHIPKQHRRLGVVVRAAGRDFAEVGIGEHAMPAVPPGGVTLAGGASGARGCGADEGALVFAVPKLVLLREGGVGPADEGRWHEDFEEAGFVVGCADEHGDFGGRVVGRVGEDVDVVDGGGVAHGDGRFDGVEEGREDGGVGDFLHAGEDAGGRARVGVAAAEGRGGVVPELGGGCGGAWGDA